MTMLPSTTTPTQPIIWKWVNFGLGSILIHLSGFWLLQNASFRPVTVELQPDITPVELIEPLPPTAPANPSVPAIPSSPSSNTPPAPPRANPVPVPPPQAAPAPVPPIASTPAATPSPAPSPTAAPSTRPSPRPIVSSSVSPSPKPSPVVPPSPPVPPPRPQVSPPPAPSPVVRPSPSSPPVPTPNPTPSPPPVSPSPAAPSQGVIATILGVQSGNGGRDEPTQLAQPQIQQQSFPALAYPLGNQAAVLQVRLLIDNQGRPEVQRILQGTDSPQMRQFVELLMQDWRFSPALSGGEPVYSFLDVSVRITPSGS